MGTNSVGQLVCTATLCQAVDMKKCVAASAPGHHARVEDSGWVAQHMHQQACSAEMGRRGSLKRPRGKVRLPDGWSIKACSRINIVWPCIMYAEPEGTQRWREGIWSWQ